MLVLENLPPNAFFSIKTLTLPKEINNYFTLLMTKEKYLVENTFGPTMESCISDNTLTVNPLLSEAKKTVKRSESLRSPPEIPVELRHLFELFENPLSIKYLFPPSISMYFQPNMSGLHIVLSMTWCVILNLIIHLIIMAVQNV